MRQTHELSLSSTVCVRWTEATQREKRKKVKSNAHWLINGTKRMVEAFGSEWRTVSLLIALITSAVKTCNRHQEKLRCMRTTSVVNTPTIINGTLLPNWISMMQLVKFKIPASKDSAYAVRAPCLLMERRRYAMNRQVTADIPLSPLLG